VLLNKGADRTFSHSHLDLIKIWHLMYEIEEIWNN